MQLNDKHIVCGRGQRNYNNEGNRICRRVVERRLAQYMDQTAGRTAKTKLVDATTRKLFKMNMVFVTRTSDNRDWVRLSNDKARTKVAHLFRDASRQARRCSDGKSKLSNARVTPVASDSDESWSLSSLFSSDDETVIAGHSDTEFNDNIAASLATMSDEVSLIASIGAVGAISGDKLSSRQQHAGNYPHSLDPPLSLEGNVPCTIESTSADDELMLYSATHNKIERNLIAHELEEARFGYSPNVYYYKGLPQQKLGQSLYPLSDDDLYSLSMVEHVEDLRMLVERNNDFQVESDLFPSIWLL